MGFHVYCTIFFLFWGVFLFLYDKVVLIMLFMRKLGLSHCDFFSTSLFAPNFRPFSFFPFSSFPFPFPFLFLPSFPFLLLRSYSFPSSPTNSFPLLSLSLVLPPIFPFFNRMGRREERKERRRRGERERGRPNDDEKKREK